MIVSNIFLSAAVIVSAAGIGNTALASTLSSGSVDVVSVKANPDNSCEISNGLIEVKISDKGDVLSLVCGDKNIIREKKGESGYFSYVTDSVSYSNLNANSMKIVCDNPEEAVVEYSTCAHPLNFTVGYVVRKGVCGIYNYMIVNCTSPHDNGLHEARMCWRVNSSEFDYAYVDDSCQGKMPTPEQLRNYVSALQDATYKLDDGTIYTKYDWSNYVVNDSIHGIMTDRSADNYGVWFVNPSYEWINSGATKQELTVHQTDKTPIVLAMFQSNHFGSVTTKWKPGERMLYGPYLLYVNSGTRDEMIADAKRQAVSEKKTWPYSWMKNDLYIPERSMVKGRIKLSDGFRTKRMAVVLAKPGIKPHLQGGNFQFWGETDAEGNFTIPSVIPGQYAVYVRALDGDATGTLETSPVTVTAGTSELGEIDWNPDRHGEVLWQIGESDGTTRGFKWSDSPRQYGLWRETPAEMVFDVETDNSAENWYYVQGNKGTWTIRYDLKELPRSPLYLTIATAGAAGGAKLSVKSNGTAVMNIKAANDGSVYRSAMLGGRDSVFTCEIPVKRLVKGVNELTLDLWNVGKSGGIMYDCIKLESGDNTGLSSQNGPVGCTGIRGEEKQQMIYDLCGRPEKNPVKGRIYVAEGRKFIAE